MFSYSEHLRELLTIKFTRLLEFRLGNPSFVPFFKRGNILGVFFTIDVPRGVP